MSTLTLDRPAHVEAEVVERELDALLITDAVNLRWLTGFTGSSGLALVGPGRRQFVTDFRYLTQSAEQLDDQWQTEISLQLLEAVAKLVPAEGAFKLGFDDGTMAVAQHTKLGELLPDGVVLVPAGGVVEALRAIKDPGELDKLRAAAQLGDRALTEVLSRGLAGRTERDVGLDLEVTMRRMGAEGASFPPIVAAGAHGALPHAAPRDVVIPPGTLCVIDWGCQLDGYASDCTRTYATSDDIDPRDREVYETVLHAQEQALAAVRPGPTGKEVDAVARDLITAAGHEEHFGHGLGHGVGLAVHEGPRLSKLSETTLEAGQVVTVEPGIYLPGAVGVRIEDLAVITEDGSEVLTSLPKALEVAPAAPGR